MEEVVREDRRQVQRTGKQFLRPSDGKPSAEERNWKNIRTSTDSILNERKDVNMYWNIIR